MEDDRQTDDQTGAIQAAGCDKRGKASPRPGERRGGTCSEGPLGAHGGLTAPRLDMCTRVEMKIGETC